MSLLSKNIHLSVSIFPLKVHVISCSAACVFPVISMRAPKKARAHQQTGSDTQKMNPKGWGPPLLLPRSANTKYKNTIKPHKGEFLKGGREIEEILMETIIHRSVEVNGIRLHVAEKGEGPVVVLLHGFPELWYSWRHQILGLADRGYRAVAPDLRGYGDSDAPASVSDYSIFHIVGDVVALIDSLTQDKVFVVGHDWGALVAWNLCMFRPDRVKALVNLSVAFSPRNPKVKPVDYFNSIYGDDYYVCKFQEPGVAEAEFARYSTQFIHRRFLTSRYTGKPFLMRKEVGFGSPDQQITLPSWLSEEDVSYFASKYEKTGFTNPINYYRNLNQNWELTAPWTGTQIVVPTKFIVGDEDLTYHYPGIQDYIQKGGLKKNVPFLEEAVVMPGVGHWINQEKAQEVTEHIYDFIRSF